MTEFSVYRCTCDWAQATGLKFWASPETGSTNTTAKNDTAPATKPWLSDLTHKASHPTLYLTSRQNHGRGRGSNAWTAPEGSALLSSWSFAVARVPQPILAPLVGLALFESVTEVWPETPFNLKAPNDLYVGDKKIGGLLIETIDQGADKRTVIGLGLNVLKAPAEIPTATCLAQHLSNPLDELKWTSFLNSWLARLNDAIRCGQSDALQAAHTERLKSALNLHPHLTEPILKVDELGQLHTATRLVRWHEL